MLSQSHAFSADGEILTLLSAFTNEDCIRAVLEDIRRISSLLRHYSFRSVRMPEQLCRALEESYRSELYTLYGERIYAHKRSDSTYLRLDQLRSDLLRIAALRLCRCRKLTLSREQLTGSEALLCAALRAQAAQRSCSSTGHISSICDSTKQGHG